MRSGVPPCRYWTCGPPSRAPEPRSVLRPGFHKRSCYLWCDLSNTSALITLRLPLQFPRQQKLMSRTVVRPRMIRSSLSTFLFLPSAWFFLFYHFVFIEIVVSHSTLTVWLFISHRRCQHRWHFNKLYTCSAIFSPYVHLSFLFSSNWIFSFLKTLLRPFFWLFFMFSSFLLSWSVSSQMKVLFVCFRSRWFPLSWQHN